MQDLMRAKAGSETQTTLGDAFKRNLKAMLMDDINALNPLNKENITDQPKPLNSFGLKNDKAYSMKSGDSKVANALANLI